MNSMPMSRDARTIEDLERAVRTLCTHFKTDTIVIIGSQSVLIEWADAPILMRTTGEIDAYPANWIEWEEAHPGEEASEEKRLLLLGHALHKAFPLGVLNSQTHHVISTKNICDNHIAFYYPFQRKPRMNMRYDKFIFILNDINKI